ncbi:hypothetical protein [Streptomyces sp. KL116D]|uniref:hypothetical protein n=1 Tax=Streptomyces sp. KL116D TaxID=3045152 RepID=UPI003555D515
MLDEPQQKRHAWVRQALEQSMTGPQILRPLAAALPWPGRTRSLRSERQFVILGAHCIRDEQLSVDDRFAGLTEG